MINRLTNVDLNATDNNETIAREPSEAGCELAEQLIAAFAGALDDENLNPFDVMQGIVQFIVSTVKTLEGIDGTPKNFRDILMRNIEVNFDYKDGKEAGIDLSSLLLEGVIKDFLNKQED
jgi:hypothetical protein